MSAKAKKNNSIIDVAAELIDSSGIDLGTVVDLAANAVSGSSKKKSGKSKKKDSIGENLISLLTSDKKDFPQFSEKTYWKLWDEFQKYIPDEVTVAILAKITGLKEATVKSTVLPALEFLGLTKKSKPTSTMKNWADEEKYEETCRSILKSSYPGSLLDIPCKTKEEQQSVINWFVKEVGVSKSVATKMMDVYLLFADPKLKSPASKTKSAAAKKSASSNGADNSVKVTTKSGKFTITVKITVDEGITKKALTEQFTAAAAEAYKQMK